MFIVLAEFSEFLFQNDDAEKAQEIKSDDKDCNIPNQEFNFGDERQPIDQIENPRFINEEDSYSDSENFDYYYYCQKLQKN